MGGKLIITVRFNPEGREAELYRKIFQGKRSAGLSMPEYVKAVLSEYFDRTEKQDKDRELLKEVRAECAVMTKKLEETMVRILEEKAAGLVNVAGGDIPESKENAADCRYGARLPEAGMELPQEALDFLDKF